MTGFPRLSALLGTIEQALSNTPKEEGYSPLFIMLPLTDGDQWQFFGWHGDAVQLDPSIGATLIGWIKGKPAYNTCFLSEETQAWCVCVRRLPHNTPISRQKYEMPTSDVHIPEEPKKDCPF